MPWRGAADGSRPRRALPTNMLAPPAMKLRPWDLDRLSEARHGPEVPNRYWTSRFALKGTQVASFEKAAGRRRWHKRPHHHEPWSPRRWTRHMRRETAAFGAKPNGSAARNSSSSAGLTRKDPGRISARCCWATTPMTAPARSRYRIARLAPHRWCRELGAVARLRPE
jgi:hypothetical protein